MVRNECPPPQPPLTRELIVPEFPLEQEVWYHYPLQEANPAEDRIFGTFVDGTNRRRCANARLHKDEHEVDGVFTLEEFRGHGLARFVVQALIDACGHEVLYMHSTLQPISVYMTFGFVPIPEDQLSRMIRERFNMLLLAKWRGVSSAQCGGMRGFEWYWLCQNIVYE